MRIVRAILQRPSVLALAAVLALGGCSAIGDPNDPELDNATKGKGGDDDPPSVLASPDVVVAWSQLVEDHAFALGTAATDPFPNSRAMTMMLLAMHDALNAIEPRYQQYAFTGSDPSADQIAAAAQAAHDVLNNLYPSRVAQNDAQLAFWLGQVPDGAAKTAGINLGAASATAIINNRASDNMLVFGSYAPVSPAGAGDYRFTPPFDFVYRPAFGNATTFAIGSVARVQPGPPPQMFSAPYALAVNEVKDFGRRNSSFRSQDQTNFAAWWLEMNELQWSRIMRQVTGTRNLDLIDSTRMLALGNVAIADATVAVWSAKIANDFWRPFHAIRLADTDGNVLTVPDTTWEPEHVTPPLPEYPSAHTIQCFAAAEALRRVLGTDNVSFSTQSSTALPSNPVRSFNSFSSAATECGVSRIMAGYHFRFSVDVSTVMGKEIGKKVVDAKLRRR